MFPAVEKKILRKMDFLSDQKGIIRRFEREEENWTEHLNNTKNKILQSAINKDKNSVIILGSGWGLDVPIVELAEMFKKVYLVDIFHPKYVRKIAKEYTNITFIEADITNGMIEKVYNFVKNYKKTFPLNIDSLFTINPVDLSEFDYIVSVNILNQLDILILDYLQRKIKISISETSEIRNHIQTNHIQTMTLNKSLLISDYEELNIDNNEAVKNIKSLIYSSEFKANKGTKWVWKFDTKKTYHNSLKTYFNVVAIDI